MEILTDLKELKKKVKDKKVGFATVIPAAVKLDKQNMSTNYKKIQGFEKKNDVVVVDIRNFLEMTKYMSGSMGQLFRMMDERKEKLDIKEIKELFNPVKDNIDYLLYRDFKKQVVDMKEFRERWQWYDKNISSKNKHLIKTKEDINMVNCYATYADIYKNIHHINIVEIPETWRSGIKTPAYKKCLEQIDIPLTIIDPAHIKGEIFKMDTSAFRYRRFKEKTKKKMENTLKTIENYYKDVGRDKFINTIKGEMEYISDYSVENTFIANEDKIMIEVVFKLNLSDYIEDFIDPDKNFKMILCE